MAYTSKHENSDDPLESALKRGRIKLQLKYFDYEDDNFNPNECPDFKAKELDGRIRLEQKPIPERDQEIQEEQKAGEPNYSKNLDDNKVMDNGYVWCCL